MKSLLLFLTMTLMSVFLFFSSCKKEYKYMSDAIITGYDGRMCACCGGLMITFNGETQPYQGDFKLIDNSSDFNIKPNDTFPIYIKVDWTSDPNKCFENYIKVTRLKRK